MKKWKVVLSIAMILVMIATVLAGCNNDTSSSTPASEKPVESKVESEEQKDVTLRFSWWGGDERHEATLKVIEAFEKLYPNIHIEAEYGAFDGYGDKKTTEFAAHTAPDIFQIETGSGPEYYKNGVLYNMSTLSSISFDKFDAAFIKSNGQFGSGSQYAIPTGVAGSALVVNKTLADAVGVDLTQQYDWRDLIDMGKKVREYDSEDYLLSVNTGNGVGFFIRCYTRQLNGVPMIDDATKKLNMTEDQFVEMFTLIRDLYKEEACAPAAYKAPYSPNKDQEDPNWIAGKYVASVGYTSNAKVLQDANPNVEYIAGCMPVLANAKSEGWVNNCPQYIGIYAETEHPEECAKFLDFFFNSDEAADILGIVRSVPPTAFAQKIVKDKGLLDTLTYQSVERSLSYSGFDDAGLSTSAESSKILEDTYEAVSYLNVTPEQAAKDVIAKLNDYLATA